MDNLRSESPKVAEEIGDLMFTFDDLSGINQHDMEQVVRSIVVEWETPLDTLARALKLADPAVTTKIRGAMGMNVKRELDEVIETIPPMRVKDVEDEQRKILKVVKEMIYSGQIGIPTSGEEELV